MTPRVVHCIYEHGEERQLDRITRHAMHRISLAHDWGGGVYHDVRPVPDYELTGWALRERFADTRKYRPGAYTGGMTPYPFLLLPSGEIHQLLEVGVIAPHARRWNLAALATSLVGDFREHAPTPEQWGSIVEWCALWHAWGLSTWGHTEMPGASSPGKACPGSRFDMDKLRQEIVRHPYSALTSWGAERVLVDLGVVF